MSQLTATLCTHPRRMQLIIHFILCWWTLYKHGDSKTSDALKLEAPRDCFRTWLMIIPELMLLSTCQNTITRNSSLSKGLTCPSPMRPLMGCLPMRHMNISVNSRSLWKRSWECWNLVVSAFLRLHGTPDNGLLKDMRYGHMQLSDGRRKLLNLPSLSETLF